MQYFETKAFIQSNLVNLKTHYVSFGGSANSVTQHLWFQVIQCSESKAEAEVV